MKGAKALVLEYLEQELLKNNNQGVETQAVAIALGMQRPNVSTILNQLVKEGILVKGSTRPVRYRLKQVVIENPLDFPAIIGENGSLSTAIQLAQAAILYPNYALPVLVLSEIGSGRTYFVDKMMEFALQNHAVEQPHLFQKINCLDYLDALDDLLHLLFGSDTSASVFEKIAEGILFIDNIHILPLADQNRLISWLNHREKEQKRHQKKGLVIIGSDAKISDHFSNKFPVVIQLPSYVNRPISEKLELLNYFFSIESKNSDRDIQVPRDVIHVFILSINISNIKELEYAVRTACANAFVRSLRADLNDLSISIDDLPIPYQGIRHLGGHDAVKIDELIGTRKALIYDKELGLLDFAKNESDDLYSKIELEYAQLAERGIEQDDVFEAVRNYIQSYIEYKPLVEKEDELKNLSQLETIVSSEVVQLVQAFVLTVQKEFNRDLNPTAYYGISLHVSAMIEQKGSLNRKLDNDAIVKVIRDYPVEYAQCSKFAKQLEGTFQITVPIDEIVILTMFIIESEKKEDSLRPILLYVLHGKGVAQSLAESTKMLTKNLQVYGFDLLLEESVENSYEKLKEYIEKIDQGLGVIVLYDMGSIKGMLDKIRSETLIKIREFEIPITMIGMGIARRCLIENDIDSVFHAFHMEMNQFYQNRDQEKIIITLCYTSEGGALQLKHYIDQYSRLGYRVIALSVANKEVLIEEVMALRKTYQVHAFVGTFDPKIMGIPFISIKDVFEQPKEHLDKLLMFMPVAVNSYDYEKVYRFLEEQFVYTSIAKVKKVLPAVLDEFNFYYQLTEEQTIGLFVHIACLVERSLSREAVKKLSKEAEEVIEKFPEDYKHIRKIMRTVEKSFKIIIDDIEVSTMIHMLRKL